MNKQFKLNAIRLAIVTGIMTSLVSLPTIAEEVNVEEDEIEVISVTGERDALERALDTKRQSDSIMDGIAADSIGEFPDLNLADTISRITGVQLDTSGAGGERREGQISLRGLPNKYARTQVNGQTLATPNFSGGFAFGVFENSVVSQVDVIKSPTAKNDAGGLSGIVDVQTKRPLNINKPFATIALDYDYEELTENFVPKASVSAGGKLLDDTLGLFGSLTYSDQSFRTDSARINGYDTEDVDDDGLADFYTPNEARYTSRTNDGDRISIAGGIEFAAADNLKFGLMGLYSKYSLVNGFDQLRVQDPTTIEASNLVDGGVYGDTYTQAIFRDAEVDAESRYVEDDYSTYGLTGDFEWTNDYWKVNGVLHYSAAAYDRVGYQVRRNIRDEAGSNIDVFVNTGAGKTEDFVIEAVNGDDWTQAEFYSYGAEASDDDPENQEWRQRFISSIGYDLDEKEKAAQIDVVRYLDSAITTIEFGFKLRQFEQSQKRPSWSAFDLDFSGIDDLGVMRPSIAQENEGFFGGDIGGIEYLVSDYALVKEQILANNIIEGETFGDMPATINNSNTFSTTKNISAAYLMTRFDLERFNSSIPVRGNIGLRYVHTDRNTQAYSTSDILVDGELTTNSQLDFSDVLPSVNVMWDITEDIMLRAAWYKTIVRPSASEFTASSSVDVDWQDAEETVPEALDIELGNPNLKPFSAEAWDISVEWYNRKGSGVTLAYFNKEVSNSIIERTTCPTSLDEIAALSDYDFSSVITGDIYLASDGKCQDQNEVEVTVEETFNDNSTFNLSGVEVGVLQNLAFLNNWARGFGIQANYTYIDTSAGPDVDESGNRLPLNNVSKETYNVSLFYDAKKWSTRFSYRNRSEYFLPSNDSFTGEDRFVGASDRLDWSFSWRPLKGLRLRAKIVNLTDIDRKEYQAIESRVRDIRHIGRTYTLGFKYKF